MHAFFAIKLFKICTLKYDTFYHSRFFFIIEAAMLLKSGDDHVYSAMEPVTKGIYAFNETKTEKAFGQQKHAILRNGYVKGHCTIIMHTVVMGKT